MGVLAFQDQVEELAAATQSRSLAMPKRAEVVTLQRVSIVRPVGRLTEKIWRIRSSYIAALHEFPPKYAMVMETGDKKNLEVTKEVLERFVRNISSPSLIDPDGCDSASLIEDLAASWAKSSSDDGRYARRLAKKLRAAGAACDVPRIKLHALVLQMLADVSLRLDAEVIEQPTKNRYDALFERSISQYPVITAHLGR